MFDGHSTTWNLSAEVRVHLYNVIDPVAWLLNEQPLHTSFWVSDIQ